jgi:AraC-like DNA-binding protein
MTLYIKYDMHHACKIILIEQLEKLAIPFEVKGLNEINFKKSITDVQQKQLSDALAKYGIEIINDQKSTLIQKIKDTIVEMVYLEEKLPSSKISAYLAGKLNHSYGYLSNLFSEVTYTSIENFIILQKIERAKQKIINNEHNLTEIAWQLNYSSVAHLSNQFKKTTGLTPTAFQRIIRRRKEMKELSLS